MEPRPPTSQMASGAARNHPTFVTKRATLIFPPWIHIGGGYRTFRGQFARDEHVYSKSLGIIGRTAEDDVEICPWATDIANL